MDKARLFKLAHKLTKSVVKAGDSYRVTFGAALKIVKTAYFGKITAQVKSWNKNGQNRFYVNFQAVGSYGLMDNQDAGYILVDGDKVSFDAVKEEFRSRIVAALEAKAFMKNLPMVEVATLSVLNF